MPHQASIKEFARAMWGDWLARLSGPFSVPAAWLAYWLSNDVGKVIFAFTAFICVWVAAYSIWRREHEAVDALTEKIKRLKERRPKLNIAVLMQMGGGRAKNIALSPLVLVIEITNTGELPSVAKDFRMYLDFGSNGIHQFRLWKPPKTITLRYDVDRTNKKEVILHDNDWIVAKSTVPIAPGNMIQGFVLADVDNLERENLIGNTLVVECKDAWGKTVIAKLIISKGVPEDVALPQMNMRVQDARGDSSEQKKETYNNE